MWEFLADRCLHLCMAAVLIFPEPATFALFLAIGLGGCLAGLQFAWTLLREDDSLQAEPIGQMS